MAVALLAGCWFGLPTPPLPVTDLVAAPTTKSVTLTWTNPTFAFWGVRVYRAEGSTPPEPSDAALVRDVGAGTSIVDSGLVPSTTYSFAVIAYGADGYYSPAVTATVTTDPGVDAVGTGAGRSCGRYHDGVVKCWGWNILGGLGNGTTTDSWVPVPVTGIATATAVDPGDGHSPCALLSSGSVVCWGDNAQGQLGDGTTTSSSTPVVVAGITTASALGVGGNHACAVLSSGSVKCWGNNLYGQLGNGTTTSSPAAVTVTGITTAVAVGTNDYHSCALLAGGTVKCWGFGLWGQLGDGGTAFSSSTPVDVSGITDAVAIAAGRHHSCAVLGDATIKCWGRNQYGQLGNGTTTDATTPVAVSGISDAETVSAADHTCAVTLGGTIYCWGYNSDGQLGRGSTAGSSVPVAVIGIDSGTNVAAGHRHSCAVVSGHTPMCWGRNVSGQLGNGTTTNSTSPVTVSGF